MSGFENVPDWFDDDIVSRFVALSRKMDALKSLPVYFCPNFVGRQDVKRAMLCMLTSPYDSVNRERIHVLLYGHPGSGKTAFLENLQSDWNAYFSSSNPKTSSLKGDARRKDRGVQIFQQYTGGILCFDDIELMEDIDTLRDVMESGKYTITKGGQHDEYDAQCRIIGATNELGHMSDAIKSRFDLVFRFDKPEKDDSIEIWRHILEREARQRIDGLSVDILKKHIELSQFWRPSPVDQDVLVDTMGLHFDSKGTGEDGRWLESVLRIARGMARLRFTDIGVDELRMSIEMKHLSDRIMYLGD